MKRNLIIGTFVVAAALLLAGGAVLAKSITCAGGPCTGTKKADRIIGTDGADQIDGKAGDDGINGRDGDDTITGGKGNDNINEGPVVFKDDDKDTVFGGAGDDRINVFDRDALDFVDCGPGNDIVFADNEANQNLINCETVDREEV
jgi:Ca2+-binding RTX toxin-like protein